MQPREDQALNSPVVKNQADSQNTPVSPDATGQPPHAVSLSDRIRHIMDCISDNLVDRDYVVKVAVLAVLAGQNIFLYGPPGTAKSMLSRRLASVVRGGKYFEHLMHRFCTPEEIFGPVSLSELKKDNYERKTAGYLPDADFAFLDEIWKSSPAVLNTLLTIINERSFHNGSRVEKVPLRSLAAASNEIPDDESGMEALYDRFPVRIPVFPVKGEESFRRLVENAAELSDADFEKKFRGISPEEYQSWLREIRRIPLSDNAVAVLSLIREEILRVSGTPLSVNDHDFQEGHDAGISGKPEPGFSYVSDRRWIQAADLLRAAAFFNGHDRVLLSELPLVVSALWNVPSEISAFRNLVYNSVKTVLSRMIRDGNTGRFLDTGREIGELMSRYSDPDSFKNSGIQVKLTPEREVWFRFLKDTGLCYRALDRMWNNDAVMEDFSLGNIWAPGIRKTVRNPRENGRTGFVPVVGDVIRIVVTRDLNGYLGNIDLPGLECFGFSVPGMLGSNGVLTDDNHFTCKVGLLPKLMQIYLKSCLDPEVELFARISGLPQHPTLDGKLQVTVRINFEGIFAERYLRPDTPFCDTDKMTEIKPVSVGIDGRSIYGEFLHEPGFRLYSAQMENGDSVIVSIEDKTPLPARGEVCEYWNRFMGRGFELCEVNSYRKWFQNRVRELRLGGCREISCRIMPDGRGNYILVHKGLCCISDELSRIQNHDELTAMMSSVVAMRLQGIDEKLCLLMVSSLNGADLTGIWLNYEGIVSMHPCDIRDENFEVSGTAESAKLDNGDCRIVMKTSEGLLETVLIDKTYKVLSDFSGDIGRLSEKMSLNRDLVATVTRDLEEHEELVNSSIFLSNSDKYEFTRLLKEIYEPYFNECSVSSTYEIQLTELLSRYEKITIPKIDMSLREQVRREAERIEAEKKALEEKAQEEMRAREEEERRQREKEAKIPPAADSALPAEASGTPVSAGDSGQKTGMDSGPDKSAPESLHEEPLVREAESKAAREQVVSEVVAGAVSGGIAGTLVSAALDNREGVSSENVSRTPSGTPAGTVKSQESAEPARGSGIAEAPAASGIRSAAGLNSVPPETSSRPNPGEPVRAATDAPELVSGNVRPESETGLASSVVPEPVRTTPGKGSQDPAAARADKPVMQQARKSGWIFKNLFSKGVKGGEAPQTPESSAVPEEPRAPVPHPERDPMHIDEAAFRDLEENDEFRYRFETAPKPREPEKSLSGAASARPSIVTSGSSGKPVIGEGTTLSQTAVPEKAPTAATGNVIPGSGKPVISGAEPSPGVSGASPKSPVSRISEIPVSPAVRPVPAPESPEKKPDPVAAAAGALPAGLLKKLQEKKVKKSPEPFQPSAAPAPEPVPAAPSSSRESAGDPGGNPHVTPARPPVFERDNSPVLSGSAPAPEPAVSSVVQNTELDFELSGAEEEMSYEQRARMERFRNRMGSSGNGEEESKPKRIDIRELLRNHRSNL